MRPTGARISGFILRMPVFAPFKSKRVLRRLRDIVEGYQAGARARHDRVSATLIVAEFDEHCVLVQNFDNSSHLPARKPLRWSIGEQRNYTQ